MRILIVADVLGAPNNGTTIAAYNLISSLESRGYEVRVLCCDKEKKGKPGYFVCDLLNLWPFNGYVKKNGVAPGKPNDRIILKALEGVDVVHCMMPFAIGNRTAKIAKEKGIPVTAGFHVQAENVSSHVFMMHFKLFNKIIYKVFYKKLYRYVDCIHYPTRFIQLDFEKVVGPTNGYIISNGVKLEYEKREVKKPTALRNKFVILSTGRYSKEKMQQTLIRAVALSKYEKDIQIILAGEGPRRNKLIKEARDLTNKPILGLHKMEDLINIINYSDLYVHTAYAELESIACLEALKCGLVPIINSTKRTATKFFAIDDNNIFTKNSAKDLAKKIDYWIEHPSERQKRSEEYLNYTNRFEFNHCMDRMEKMINEAIVVHKYKIEHNLKGRFVYYNDPINEDFASTNFNTQQVDDNFTYVHKNIFWRISSKILYKLIVVPLIWLFANLFPCARVHNKKVLKNLKGRGYFVYGNHTTMMDGVLTQAKVSTSRTSYIIANPDVISIPGIRNLVMLLGALPTPSSAESNKKFVDAIETRFNQKAVIIIYPEAHIWPYCQEIRPFKDVSFKYAAQLNAPVIASAVTYRYPKWKINKWRKPFIDITLSNPIYPQPGLSVSENQKILRNQVYDFLNKTINENKKIDKIEYVKAPEGSAKYNF